MKTKTAVPKIVKQAEIVEGVNSESCSVKETVNKANSLLDTLNKAIERDNISFDQMSKMEKRVALAKDVIASLIAKKYVAETSTYLAVGNEEHYTNKMLDVVKNGKVKCTVCAIGSLFVSRLKTSDTLKLTSSDHVMIKSLAGIFTEKELRILEFLFEGRNMGEDNISDIYDDGYEFYTNFFNRSIRDNGDKKRLKAIMQNIINNNGNFIYKSIKI